MTGDDETRQAGAAADVEQALAGRSRRAAAQRPDDGEAIEHVLRHHRPGVAYCGQVVGGAPPLDQSDVGHQAVDLRRRSTTTSRPPPQRSSGGSASVAAVARPRQSSVGASVGASVKPRTAMPFLTWTSSRDIAAGVTPGKRDAAPMLAGRCEVPAWRASNDRARTRTEVEIVGDSAIGARRALRDVGILLVDIAGVLSPRISTCSITASASGRPSLGAQCFT